MIRAGNWKLGLSKEVRSYDVLLHILKRLREHAWPETEAELAWPYLMKSSSLVLFIASLAASTANSVFWVYVIWLYDCPFPPLWQGGNNCFPVTCCQTLLLRSMITKIFRHLRFTLSKCRLSNFTTVLQRTSSQLLRHPTLSRAVYWKATSSS